jgi:hypothetical protein
MLSQLMRKRNGTQSITSLPMSPEEERRSRVRKYTITMAIRTLCVVSLIFVRDWWMIVSITGAVVLPYFAVVIANVKSRPPTQSTSVERPGAVVPLPPPNLADGPAGRPRAS